VNRVCRHSLTSRHELPLQESESSSAISVDLTYRNKGWHELPLQESESSSAISVDLTYRNQGYLSVGY
jgi:hypothetical protein